MKLQEAVKKETGRVFAATGAGTAVMLLVFFLLHIAHVLGDVPFGAPEIVSGIIGWLVASLNFFLMAVTVQKVAGFSEDNKDRAKKTMAASYRYRMILQLVWAVVSFLVPFFNPAAGIIPLFIPSVVIKIKGVVDSRKAKKDSGSSGGQNPKGEVSA